MREEDKNSLLTTKESEMVDDKKRLEKNKVSKEKKKNLHIGHRDRLRQQAVNMGIDYWPDHQVLEYLLFFGLPQKDTNEIAHELIDKYGSFLNVFDASFESLKQVKGLGKSAAGLITFVPKLFRYIENARVKNKNVIFTKASQVVQYMKPKFYNLSNEVLYILTLDNKQKLISASVILEGDINKVNIDKRKIIEKVIEDNASNIMLCHNHPFGISVPSHDDVLATRKIVSFLSEIGIGVLDHIIIAEAEYCSMNEMEYLDINI